MPYTPKSNLPISIQNEPAHHVCFSEDFRQYPDMYSAYENVKRLLGNDRFILTNGCENALRIALLAINPIELQYETPGWGLVPIIAESLDILHKPIVFHINKYNDIIYSNADKNSLIYVTDSINNFFKHDMYMFKNMKIIDISYTMDLNLIKRNKDNFIIGSFSKIAGAGLRLGILIYPEKYRHKVNLLREQYINTAAADYITNLAEWPKFNIKENDGDNNAMFRHAVYTLYNDKPNNKNIPYKKVFIDNKTFYRVGVKPLGQ